MTTISLSQARVMLSRMRVELATTTDPEQKAEIAGRIRRLNSAAGQVDAKRTFREKLAVLGRDMAGAY